MKRIKIAQIGMEHDHAAEIMTCMRKLPECFEVMGIAESDDRIYEEKYQLPSYCGIRRMTVDEILSDPDIEAVAVETGELNLVSTATMCIKAGKHVHMDKPAGEDFREFSDLMQLVKKKNLTLQLGYMYRYNPSVMKLMDMIRSGVLGEIYEVSAIMDSEHLPEKRDWLNRFQGGIMFFLGCHMVDLVYRIMGEPEEILPYNMSSGIGGVTAPDQGLALFKYKRGISIVKATSTEVNGYARRQLVVCGDKGTAEIMPLETHDNDSWCRMWYSTHEMTEGRTWADIRQTMPPERIDGRYHEMMRDFYRFAVGEKENPYSPDYEVNVHRAILKACGMY